MLIEIKYIRRSRLYLSRLLRPAHTTSPPRREAPFIAFYHDDTLEAPARLPLARTPAQERRLSPPLVVNRRRDASAHDIAYLK